MRILHVVGARPNFMKISPLMKEMSNHPNDFEQVLVHTGQHYDMDMSRIFLDELGLSKADIYLNVGSGTHAQQTAQIMSCFEPVLNEYRPDWLIVVGDVNSTIACSLVASKMAIPVAHIEAGLRSFDRSMPEEINRILTDQLSDLLFVSEPSGLENLSKEGIPERKIHFVGNVMIDTLIQFREKAEQSNILGKLGICEGEYLMLTLHRPSNVDGEIVFRNILTSLKHIAHHIPIIFPVHPRTKKMIRELNLEEFFFNDIHIKEPFLTNGIHRITPLGYIDFCKLMTHAKAVLTDSGGIQEETTYLGVPCLTLRENTERPVTVDKGTNIIVGTDPKKISNECSSILNNKGKKGEIPRLWDGKAARRIVDVFRKNINGTSEIGHH